jgi:hypothetical protein
MEQRGRGGRVIVRAYGDRPLVRRVWDYDGSAVLIAGEREFHLLERGEEAPMPVGFPPEDVFRYDAELAHVIARGGSLDWGHLIRWAQ